MKLKIQTPKASSEVDDFIEAIAEFQKQEAKTIEEANEQIKRIGNRANRRVGLIRGRISKLAFLIRNYYVANKKELTSNGKLKVVKLLNGVFREYFTKRSVRLIGDESGAAEELEKAGLGRFVRIKKEIDKDAILRHPEKVAGIKSVKIIEKKKRFLITPRETNISIIIDVKSE